MFKPKETSLVKGKNAMVQSLCAHLEKEDQDLSSFVQTTLDMDSVLHRLGLYERHETLTSRISWWPVVSVVGLYSAGKSTAINDLLGVTVQKTGKQAVDDKFTVICYGQKQMDLPGTALMNDGRLPFYRMSDEIEKVAPGEGLLTDKFLALKAVNSDVLKGLVLVDSPGFDADEERASKLRLVDHILDLSDLVLVLCDANKVESGVMKNTLEHLVRKSHRRSDSHKFCYILNQIDVTAKDNNLEEVVAAWQRSMSSTEQTSSRFYLTYSESARIDIQDPDVAARLKSIRDRDMGDLRKAINKLRDVRGYHIARTIEAVEKVLSNDVGQTLERRINAWRKLTNICTIAAGTAGLITLTAVASIVPELLALFIEQAAVAFGVCAVVAFASHWYIGGLVAARLAKNLPEKYSEFDLNVRAAFLRRARGLAFLRKGPQVMTGKVVDKVGAIQNKVSALVQELNDRFASPTGKASRKPVKDVKHAVRA
ncbi:dynamin family protein [Thalassospira xianhensis]|nr:dynamin family protein [Thalassospira xianhensis]